MRLAIGAKLQCWHKLISILTSFAISMRANRELERIGKGGLHLRKHRTWWGKLVCQVESGCWWSPHSVVSAALLALCPVHSSSHTYLRLRLPLRFAASPVGPVFQCFSRSMRKVLSAEFPPSKTSICIPGYQGCRGGESFLRCTTNEMMHDKWDEFAGSLQFGYKCELLRVGRLDQISVSNPTDQRAGTIAASHLKLKIRPSRSQENKLTGLEWGVLDRPFPKIVLGETRRVILQVG